MEEHNRKPLKYVSFCSGVEAASQAWEPLGWKPVAFSEIEPFPSAVLAARFPDVPNLGDMTKIRYDREKGELSNGTDVVVCDGGIDLVVGGTPCQSFSVAGRREGLEGASGLAEHYARLLGEIRPRWFVWENVPGALSSVTYGDQRDFNFLLDEFRKRGPYDCEWRVLDTQYVRVERFARAIPQRRRRVFVVGHLAADGAGGWPVLLEPEGLRGDPPPRRVKGEGAAGDPADRARGAGREVECLTPSADHPQTHRVYGTGGAYPSIMCNGGQAGQDQSGILVPAAARALGVKFGEIMRIGGEARRNGELMPTLASSDGKLGDNAPSVAIAFKGGQSAAGGLGAEVEVAQTMQRRMSALEPTVAIRTGHTSANGCGFQEEVTHALGAADLDAVAYKIDSAASNAMRSGNPKSGVHRVDAHSALDTTDPNPTKAQGGIALAVPVALRGNRRAGEEGKLAETDGREAAYSLTHVQTDSMVATKEWRTSNGKEVYPTIDGSLRKAVGHQSETSGMYVCGPVDRERPSGCYENHQTDSRVVETDVAPCAGATHNGGWDNNNPLVGYRYAVRRITPVEAERLQGFADNWTVPPFDGAALTDDLCDRFIAIHGAWAAINGKPDAKPKSRAAVRRWLAEISSPATCPDGPRYKAIGNSMSVNVMLWIGMRIALAERATA